MPDLQYIDLQFPKSGVDTSNGFSQQAPGTTAQASNVRTYELSTDRARGASRPGLAKFVSGIIGGGSAIQCIESVPITKDQTAGTGNFLAQGATSITYTIRSQTDGTQVTGGYTATATFPSGYDNSLGCTDENGNAYVIAVRGSSHVYSLVKIGSDFTEKWRVGTALSGAPVIAGLCVLGSYVYLRLANSSSSSVPRVYRFSVTDGSLVDELASQSFAVANGITTSHQMMCIAGGTLNLVQNTGNGLRLFQGPLTDTWTSTNYRNALVVDAPTDNSVSFPVPTQPINCAAKVVGDSAGNCYVLITDTSGINNYLVKVDSSGNRPWKIYSTSAGAKDIAYDPVNNHIGCVGDTATFGNLPGVTSGSTFVRINVSSGAVVSSAAPGSTTWNAICADGFGNFDLRNVSGTNDITSISSANAVRSGFPISSGFVPSGPRLWLTGINPSIASTATSMYSSRLIRELAVAGGGLYRFDGGSVSTINASFLNSTAPVVYSAINGLYVYFVDGGVYKKYSAATNTTSNWIASNGGTLPTDNRGGYCRLIATCFGRTCLAGLLSDPSNWFFSAVDDPLNFSYLPNPTLETQAVAGNNTPAGLVPDIVNCLCPYDADTLIFGGTSSIWIMRGDPMAGGRLYRIADGTGMAWGRPFCKGPDGTLYFFASRGGVYAMLPPDGKPVPIFQNISDELKDIDVGANIITMAWDDRSQSLHLMISPIVNATSRHYCWEARNKAWWPVDFGNNNHNALAVHALNADSPSDRQVLYGGRDGFIRYFSGSASTDDGTAISSYVWIGPFLTPDLDDVTLCELQAELALTSGSVTVSVYVGRTAEEALGSTAVYTGTWSGGRNVVEHLQFSGYAVYWKISSTNAWAFERVRCGVKARGKIRRRSI